MSSLAFYRKKCGYSQREVAEHLGVSQQSYQKYEKGKTRITESTLTALSKLFGVTIDNLLAEAPEFTNVTSAQEDNKDTGACVIPFYNAGQQASRPTDTYEVSKELWRTYGEDLYAQRATGNSMSPVINAGDVLIFARNLSWVNGDILSVCVDGLHFVKAVHKHENGVSLNPINPLFDIQHITHDKLDVYEFSVVGKLVQVIRSFA